MHLRADRRNVLLLELASQVPLDERGLPDAAISNQHELKGRNDGAGLEEGDAGAGEEGVGWKEQRRGLGESAVPPAETWLGWNAAAAVIASPAPSRGNEAKAHHFLA